MWLFYCDISKIVAFLILYLSLFNSLLYYLHFYFIRWLIKTESISFFFSRSPSTLIPWSVHWKSNEMFHNSLGWSCSFTAVLHYLAQVGFNKGILFLWRNSSLGRVLVKVFQININRIPFYMYIYMYVCMSYVLYRSNRILFLCTYLLKVMGKL